MTRKKQQKLCDMININYVKPLIRMKDESSIEKVMTLIDYRVTFMNETQRKKS